MYFYINANKTKNYSNTNFSLGVKLPFVPINAMNTRNVTKNLEDIL